VRHCGRAGGLLYLSCRSRQSVSRKHPWNAKRQREPGFSALRRLPRHTSCAEQKPIEFPHIFTKCSGSLRAVPSHGTKSGFEVQRAANRNPGTLQREHSRQRSARSRLDCDADCADCHTPHHELPKADPRSSVNPKNIAATCSKCHRGIYEQFVGSVHSPEVTKTGKQQPTCSECHTAHTIQRTDITDFRLHIMDQCGRCHKEITDTYFDTYHGKVSKLGYVKTAKCYDCHGAHDIRRVDDQKSRLSRANIVGTCGKCHPGSTADLQAT